MNSAYWLSGGERYQLIVSFSTKKLRDACQSLEIAEKTFGVDNAQALFSLLAEVEAVETADELAALYGDHAGLDGEDSILISFTPEWHARFDAVQTARESDESRQLNWSEVRRVKLVFVGARNNG